MIKGLSLFSNVGIGELLLEKAGVEIVVANELEKNRAKFYQHVFPKSKMICGDVNEKYEEIIKTAKKEKCNFIIATPPCQGLSVAGKRDYTDKRNQLIIPVLNAIRTLKPDYVLIENVTQLLKFKIEYKNKIDTVENIIEEEFGGLYYINKQKIIDTKNYGIAQTRKRAIILMSKIKPWVFPQEEKIITVRDMIADLPSVEAIVEGNPDFFEGNLDKIKKCKKISKWHFPKNHSKRHVECMMHTPTGKSAFENEIYYPKKNSGEKVKGYNTTYKRMEWDKPAPTITMGNGMISSQCNVHPGRLLGNGIYSDARVLTIFEIMKLFSIPDDWDIPDWAGENFIREVIGEAIPPLLIYKLVKELEVK